MNRVRCLIFNAALGPLDYSVPEGMDVAPGAVVACPLGPRTVLGIVWESERLPGADVPAAKLRLLREVLPVPPLAAPLRRLIDAMVPELGTAMRVAGDPLVGQALAALTGVDTAQVAARFADTIDETIWREMGNEEAAIRADPAATNDAAIIAIFGPAARF